jgi:hypothetical protein
MNYELTQHAQKVLHEREINVQWMESTLANPEWIVPDPVDPEVQRYYRRIPEFGNRVLRVAVNVTVEPPRIVSVFFDRTQNKPTQKGQP